MPTFSGLFSRAIDIFLSKYSTTVVRAPIPLIGVFLQGTEQEEFSIKVVQNMAFKNRLEVSKLDMTSDPHQGSTV